MRAGIILLLLIVGALPTLGADIYVAQTAQGSDTGADAANAHSAAWFNTSGNWGAGAGKISPGDTAHLTGNITTALTTQASGSAGNITTILFAPGATMSVPAWASPSALRVNNSYITVDGGATGTMGGPNGNPALANGIIEDTDNGVGKGNQVTNASGVFVDTSNHVTIKGLVIRNFFIRTSGTDETSNGNNGVKTDGCNDLLVTNCIFHDNERGALFYFRSGNSNIEYSYTTAYNCNWGGGAGPGADGSTLSSLLVHDNYFYGWSNWDDSLANYYHHNGFFCYSTIGQPNSYATGIRYYNNQVGSGTSGEWGTRTSGGLFIQDKVYDAWWYNNLIIGDATTAPADGYIYCDPQGAITSTYRIFTNTLIGLSNSLGYAVFLDAWQNSGGVQTVYVENNIMKGMRFPIVVFNDATIALTSDHNLIYGNDASTPYSYSATSSGSFKSIAQWKALGFDSDLLTSDPLLSGTYALMASSSAIGAGANLSSYFTTDKAGATRSVPWDIGAYAYATPTPTPASGGAIDL